MTSDSDTPREPRRHVRWQDMTWKDYIRVVAGLVMFVLGVLGLVLPILQGMLFLIVSAILLAPYSRWVARQLDRAEQRFPWLAGRARATTRRWQHRTDDADRDS